MPLSIVLLQYHIFMKVILAFYYLHHHQYSFCLNILSINFGISSHAFWEEHRDWWYFTRVPSFITYPITHWSTLWLWGRIIRCSFLPSMHWFSSSMTYMLTVFTRVHSIRIKPSRIIIVHIWIAGNFSWISINSSATLS